MNIVRAEFLKLRRSLAWAVVVGLPVILAVSGVVNTLLDGRPLEDGWHTLWMRALVFYGLFPLAVGLSIVGSLLWRPEHRGSNAYALMSAPARPVSIVAAKAAVLSLLAAAMQAVMLVAVVIVGKVAFGLPGMLPGEYVLVSLVVALACVPLAALQSGLSMLLRSFAAPVAVAVVGAGLSSGAIVANLDAVVFVSPYAAVSRATQLGTGTFADDGAIAPGSVLALLAAAGLMTAAIVALSARVLGRRDVRT